MSFGHHFEFGLPVSSAIFHVNVLYVKDLDTNFLFFPANVVTLLSNLG